MPVKCERREGKYRVVESSTGRIAKTSKGNAADGGGHSSRRACQKQAAAINSRNK